MGGKERVSSVTAVLTPSQTASLNKAMLWGEGALLEAEDEADAAAGGGGETEATGGGGAGALGGSGTKAGPLLLALSLRLSLACLASLSLASLFWESFTTTLGLERDRRRLPPADELSSRLGGASSSASLQTSMHSVSIALAAWSA